MARRTPKARPALAAALLALPLLGASPCTPSHVSLGLPQVDGRIPVDVGLFSGFDPTQTQVFLDGVDVTADFEPVPRGLVGSIPRAAPATEQRISFFAQLELVGGFTIPLFTGVRFISPAAAAPVEEVVIDGAGGLAPHTAWIRLRFAGALDPGALSTWGFGIECDGEPVAQSAHFAPDDNLILNPAPELPAGADCRVAWTGPGGDVEEIAFAVATDSAEPAATALYDREDPLQLAPFPDDYWSVPDPGSATGLRIEIDEPPFALAERQAFQALLNATGELDGFSRFGFAVMAFSRPLDPSVIPADEIASMDPFAPIRLVDWDPESPDFGARIPYVLTLRTDEAPDGSSDHAAMLFPAVDLREGGRYALVVTRRAFAEGDAGRPLGPSTFFTRAVGEPDASDSDAVLRAREAIEPVLALFESLPGVPIPREDVALALSIPVGTLPGVGDDLAAIKEQALASPPPRFTVGVDPQSAEYLIEPTADGGLVVQGTVALPRYRDPVTNVFRRDPDTGAPVPLLPAAVPFRLSYPPEAFDGPVPMVMYQHGNPGSPSEVTRARLNGYHHDAGFAVAGMQDTLNREFGEDIAAQVTGIFLFLLASGQVADFGKQTGADMIWFLRALQGLDDPTNLFPPDAGIDPLPVIDTEKLLYHGISEGGNNSLRFLPYAPELIAATPTVGGGRLMETLIHQSADDILAQLGAFLPNLRPVELWIGLALFQHAYDPQEGHAYARHLFREPLTFTGLEGVPPPSLLWTEGIGDSLVPNHATRSAALELGIPSVRRLQVPAPILPVVDSPLRANFGPGLTTGHFQFAPSTTPSCVDEGQTEGHFCPQTASEAQEQRLHFFETALSNTAPEIIDPLP